MAPTDQQVADLNAKVGRLDVLVRQLQGRLKTIDQPGTMALYFGGQIPAGYALLNGQQVDAAQNPTLAGIFGQASGQVTLPDMRDRFPVGAGLGYALGAVGGENTHPLTAAESGMPSHNHSGLTGGADRSIDHLHHAPSGWYFALTDAGIGGQVGSTMFTVNTYGDLIGSSDRSLDHLHGIPTQSANAAVGHENRPPYRAVNYMIRLG